MNRMDQLQRYEPQLSEDHLSRHRRSQMPAYRKGFIAEDFDVSSKLGTFVVLDTETTGLSADRDRVIQLSAIRYVNQKPVQYWNTYINPHCEIKPGASAVNGITEDMVEDCPDIGEYAQSFLDFMQNSPAVGYNVDFDLGFLWCSGIDLITGRDIYDCMLSAYGAVPKGTIPNRRLTTLADYYGIQFQAHNSLFDAYATGEVFLRVIADITGKHPR